MDVRRIMFWTRRDVRPISTPKPEVNNSVTSSDFQSELKKQAETQEAQLQVEVKKEPPMIVKYGLPPEILKKKYPIEQQEMVKYAVPPEILKEQYPIQQQNMVKYAVPPQRF